MQSIAESTESKADKLAVAAIRGYTSTVEAIFASVVYDVINGHPELMDEKGKNNLTKEGEALFIRQKTELANTKLEKNQKGEGFPILHKVIQNRDMPMFKILVKEGADVMP